MDEPETEGVVSFSCNPLPSAEEDMGSGLVFQHDGYQDRIRETDGKKRNRHQNVEIQDLIL